MIAIGEITMVIIGHDTSFRQNPFYTCDNWDMLTRNQEVKCGRAMRYSVKIIGQKMTKSFFRFFIAAVTIPALSGCSPLIENQRSDLRDPFENENRKVFAFNMGFDTYVVEPAADAYRTSVPIGGQRAISNHIKWAGMPSIAINSALQGKAENAGLATLNFLVNGLVLGFADLMEDDTQITEEDFGQTLAAANLPEGSFLMVPFLGPKTTRSIVGTIGDMVMNPVGTLAVSGNLQTVNQLRVPITAIDFRARTFGAFNDVKYNAIDPYSRVRSVYYQTRAGMLKDRISSSIGASKSDDEFDAFFEDDS